MSYQQAAELWLADNWLRMTSCQFGGTGRKDWKGTKGWKAAETRSAYWTPRRKGLLGSFLSAAQSAQPKRLLLLGDSPSTLHTAPPRSARTTASSQRRGEHQACSVQDGRRGPAGLLTCTGDTGRYTNPKAASRPRPTPSSSTWCGWLPCALLRVTSPEPSPALLHRQLCRACCPARIFVPLENMHVHVIWIIYHRIVII